MSRVRRGDANLHFPKRIVQLNRVEPTEDERRLIAVLAKPVRDLKEPVCADQHSSGAHQQPRRLTRTAQQYGAQSDVSADALLSWSMTLSVRCHRARNCEDLSTLVDNLQDTAGNHRLADGRFHRPTRNTNDHSGVPRERRIPVRIINETQGRATRRDNQTLLENAGRLPCHCLDRGRIGRHQLASRQCARKLRPPWNPMIVEQRIGRIQRLASLTPRLHISTSSSTGRSRVHRRPPHGKTAALSARGQRRRGVVGSCWSGRGRGRRRKGFEEKDPPNW